MDVISPEQVILSHTPFKMEVVPRFINDRVLIVGKNCAPSSKSIRPAQSQGHSRILSVWLATIRFLANNIGWKSALVRMGIWNGDVEELRGSAVPTCVVDSL